MGVDSLFPSDCACLIRIIMRGWPILVIVAVYHSRFDTSRKENRVLSLVKYSIVFKKKYILLEQFCIEIGGGVLGTKLFQQSPKPKPEPEPQPEPYFRL